MPTGTCNFPQHHGPSAGQPFCLIALIAAGAFIIVHWRTVVVCLIVGVVLTVLGGLVVMMIHRRHDAAAEHQAWLVDRQAELARRAQRQQMAAPQRPEIHNHVHLHGLTAEDVAGVISGQVNHAIDGRVTYSED